MADEKNGVRRPTRRAVIACSLSVRAQIDRYGRSHEDAAEVGHYRWKLTNHDACTIILVEYQSTNAPLGFRLWRSYVNGRSRSGGTPRAEVRILHGSCINYSFSLRSQVPCWPLRRPATKSHAKSATQRAIDGRRLHLRKDLLRAACPCLPRKTRRMTRGRWPAGRRRIARRDWQPEK